jgi:hypothetical protein
MAINRTGRYIGVTLGGLALLSMLRPKASENAPEPEAEGDDGFDDPTRGAMGLSPARYLRDDAVHGSFYESRRGDILLGHGPKSITWRALYQAALDAGFHADTPGGVSAECIADDSARRVAYAGLICAAPANAAHLTHELRERDFRNHEGVGIDLRTRPILWLPVIDLEMLARCGVVQATRWEEDGTSTLEVPPELRHDV